MLILLFAKFSVCTLFVQYELADHILHVHVHVHFVHVYAALKLKTSVNQFTG